ncbi:MAG: prephenate dehydratase [Pseudomonadota bacterium]
MSADDTDARLGELRQRIDAIDEQLQTLLNERAQCALDVGEVKQAVESAHSNPVFFRPEREAQILTRIQERNEGPLPDSAVATLFREIISCCLSLEQPLTIAYLGPSGTYTEAAATKQFGHFATTRAQGSIDEVFRAVEAGTVHYGVVPVENSTEGMVNHTLDCFMDSQLRICAEVELPIHHSFLAPAAVDAEAIVEVVSHAQSLAQCRAWLDNNYPNAQRTAVASNGEAARLVSERSDAAAIASAVAGERYGLRALANNIEDQADNKTRFLVIGQQRVGPSGRDKTSIIVSTRNEPGALYKVLGPFHRHEISLSRIETRPARSGNWSYVFFIDLEGHEGDPLVRTALNDVETVAMEVRVLGSYPQAVV